MKQLKTIIIPFISLLAVSCEDVLDTKTVNEWDETKVWKIPELAEGVLIQVYSAIPSRPDNFDENFLDAATDNAVTNNFSSNIYKAGYGGITTSDNPLSNWDNCYTQMQHIHLFMEKGLTDSLLYDRVNPETDAAIKSRLKGEAFFLRAWWGFHLLQRHGGKTDNGKALGYPIITHFITDEEGHNVEAYTRNTYQECVSQIMADCDSAIARLPFNYQTGQDVVTGATKIGRATAAAAAVLKSDVALYGASPAFQPDQTVKINGMGSFTITNEDAYLKNWEKAALVADTVLRSNGFGNFIGIVATNLADGPTSTPADFIFRKYFDSNDMEKRHYPPFYKGAAQTTPSQNLADAFPAKNGFPVTDSRSKYDPNNPFAIVRDNRFEMNIYYQGRKFATNSEKIDVVNGGKDSESFHRNASRTGYYLAKFMSKKDNMLVPTQSLTSIHYYPILRKAEVFLNFAEASNEAWGPNAKGPGCKYSAYEVVKEIRRASGGITDVIYLNEMASDKDSFRKLIQNERRIELAFENHRFFDIRRWLLPLNEEIKGIIVTRNAGNQFSYKEKQVEIRNMNDIRYYNLTVPYGELLKNKNLVNNMGWDN